MAISYVSSSAVASIYPTTRTTTTVAMPTGAAAGDLVLISVNAEITGSTGPTITPPGSVTALYVGDYGKSGEAWNTAGLYAYRVIGTGDPSGFAFTHAAAWTDAAAVLLRGVDASTPVDAGPTAASGTGTSASFASVTTLTAAAWLVGVRWSWDGNAISPPAGWTERIDQAVTWIGHVARPSAGATGAITVSSGNGSSTPPSPWLSVDVALRPAGSGTTYQVTGTLATQTTTAGSTVFKGAPSSSNAIITTEVGAVTFTGELVGTNTVVFVGSGSPTSYQEISASDIIMSPATGIVSSYGELSGTVSVTANNIGVVTSRQEISSTNSVVTNATGSVAVMTPVEGVTETISTVSGDVVIISGSTTYQINSTVTVSSAVTGTTTSREQLLGVVPITSSSLGSVSIVGVPVYDISGTVSLNTSVVAEVIQHSSVSGTLSDMSAILGAVNALFVALGSSAGISGTTGVTTSIQDLSGISISQTSTSGVVRISGAVGLPETIHLAGQVFTVRLDGRDQNILVTDRDEQIVLKARYNEMTLEAH